MGNQQGKSAYSQNASGKPKKNVTWKSAEEPQQPGRPMLLSLSDQQPDVLTLKWDRPSSDGGAQITGYIVEHRRMGSPHWVRSVPQLILINEVAISGLEPGWKYQFRVIAVNVVGKSQPSELSDLLTVTLQRNAITVPRFNSELPEYMHVVEDERVELRVAVMGTPPPEISWFKDGFEIFSSRRTKIVSDNDSSVLIFHQVALTDDGEIKCTATNKAGHVATRCKLVVEAPPKIRLPRNYEEGLIVEADEVLRLKVGIAGQPQPEIQWIHEGQVISPKDIRYEVATSDKNSAIKINNVKRQDRGEYTVRASNKLGDDVASFLVTVTAKPEAPGKVKLKMSVGKSATLTWTPPPDDGGCKIGNYIVEYYRIGWNVWLKASTTRQLTTTLNDLIEGSEYKFRVKAENPYGVSEPSVESDILVIPDSKKSNPTIEEPPVPPKRRTLSPLRSLETRGTSPMRPKPELKHFESENLHLEMSYGTPNQVLETPKLEANKSVKRSPSPMIQKPPKKQTVDEGTSTENEGSTVAPPRSFNISSDEKSPLGVRRNSDRRTSLEKVIQERKASLEKMVQERKLSLEQEANVSLDQINSKKASLEMINQERKSSLDGRADSISSNISLALRRSQEPVEHNEILITDKIPMDSLKIEKPVSSNDEKQSDFQTSNEFLLVFHSNKPPGSGIEKHDSFELDLEEALSPPRISISTPDLLTAESELMKVFPIRRSVSSTELLYERAMAKFYEAVELEEAGRSRKSSVAPERGISESSQNYPRKRLGSMTEAERLSFEKRSQFRRRSDASQPMKKWGSKDSFENKGKRSRAAFFDNKSDIDTSASQAAYALHKKNEELVANEEKEYGSDYTASTDASMSEDESMERFKNEVRSRSVGTVGTRRTQSTGLEAADLETYHPRDMTAGVFTPYRSPTPDASAVALTKPVPLPDPNFVPKPILKKMSKENSTSKEGKKSRRNSKEENNPGNNNGHNSGNPGHNPGNPGHNPGNPGEEKKEKSKGGIKSFFKKKDKGEKKIDPKAMEAERKAKEQAELEQKRKAREEEERIKKEQEKVSQEEAKVVVDHYSDLVREIGSTKKYHVPLYMNKEELQKAGLQNDDDDEGEAFNKPTIPVTAPPPLQPSPKLSLIERKQMQHVQNSASKLAITKEQQIKRDDTHNDKPEEKITVTEETRGRSKIIKVKRIIKKRVPSRSRSRVHENGGNVVDNQIVAAMSSHMNSVQAKSEESNPVENEERRLVPVKSTDELLEEAQDTIKAAINYLIDLGLFLFACYVYIFKDARLVIPILALIIYRQIGDTVKGMIPDWIKRRFSSSS